MSCRCFSIFVVQSYVVTCKWDFTESGNYVTRLFIFVLMAFKREPQHCIPPPHSSLIFSPACGESVWVVIDLVFILDTLLTTGSD